MKKSLLLLLLLSLAFVMGGCKKEKTFKYLVQDEIFAQEGTYFIIFHRADCADCEETKPLIKSYLEIIKKDSEKYADKSLIYIVDLSNKKNEEIFRVYKESRHNKGQGQGPNERFLVDGIEKWDELYIAETASLISIGTTSTGVVKARFEASGYESILERLTEHLDLG